MGVGCDHWVGFIPGGEIGADEWNQKLVSFMAKVDDFNVRGQRCQVAHPGHVLEYRFCPNCGAPIDRSELGLLSWDAAWRAYVTAKSAG